MGIVELLFVAIGLSMDAFAVAICKGLSIQKIRIRDMLVVGLYFGVFQGMMPLIGYLVGSQFKDYITAVDHWIAFGLLVIIGANMIRESFSKEIDAESSSTSPKVMLPLAIATSIDALAVGVSFAFLEVQIIPAITFISVVTFGLSVAGVKIGNIFGCKYKSKAELAGGIILVLMGTKILLEHLGVLSF